MANIQVAIRVRPLIQRELDSGNETRWLVKNNNITCTEQGKQSDWMFDHVFDSNTVNLDLFESIGRQIVDDAVNGFNGTIFAYGQSGSGKTHTMTGTALQPGVISLAVEEIFKKIENIPDREFLIRVGFMEIYNEKVSDLLTDDDTPALKIQDDSDHNVQVVGLVEEIVKDVVEVMKVIKKGDVKRHTSETKENTRSSRSHAILRFVVESRAVGHEDDAVKVSNLYFVDLAGSEKAADNTGERRREGLSINKSLFTLGMVIRKLSGDSSQQHVSLRDSNLTRILSNALGGNSMTAIVCTISPARVDESISTLKFASRAKNIKNKPIVNEVMSEAAMLRRYQQKVRDLQRQIEEMNDDKKVQVDRTEMEKQKETIDKLKAMIVTSGSSHVPETRAKRKRRETWGGHKLKRHRASIMADIPEVPNELSLLSDVPMPKISSPKRWSSEPLEESLHVFEFEELASPQNDTIAVNDTVKELFALQDEHEVLMEEFKKNKDELTELQEFTAFEREMEAETIKELNKRVKNLEGQVESNPWLEEELLKVQQERNSLRQKVEAMTLQLEAANDGTGISNAVKKLGDSETKTSELTSDLEVQKSRYEFHIEQMKKQLESYVMLMEKNGIDQEQIKRSSVEDEVSKEQTDRSAKHEQELTALRDEIDMLVISLDTEKKNVKEMEAVFEAEFEQQKKTFNADLKESSEAIKIYQEECLSMKSQYERELSGLRDELDKMRTEVSNNVDNQSKDCKKCDVANKNVTFDFDSEIATLKDRYESKIQELIEERDAEKSRNQELINSLETEGLEDKYVNKIRELTEERDVEKSRNRELIDLRFDFDSEIEGMKDQYESRIKELTEERDAEISKNLERMDNLQTEELKDQYENRIKELTEERDAEISKNLERMDNLQTEELKDQYENRIKELTEERDAEISKNLERMDNLQTEELKDQYENRIKELTEERDAEISKNLERMENLEREGLNDKYEHMIKELTDERDAQISKNEDLLNDHAVEIEKIKDEFRKFVEENFLHDKDNVKDTMQSCKEDVEQVKSQLELTEADSASAENLVMEGISNEQRVQYEKVIEDCQNELYTMREDIQKLCEEIKVLQDRIQKLKQEKIDLLNSRSQAEKEITELQEKLQDIQKVADTDCERLSMESVLNAGVEKLVKDKSNEDDPQKQIATIEAERNILKHDQIESENTIRDLKVNNRTLKYDCNALNTGCDTHNAMETDFGEMQVKIEKLQGEITALEMEKCQLLDAGKEKDMEMFKLQEQIASSKMSTNNLEDATEKETYKQLQTNIEALLQEIGSLRNRKQELEDAETANENDIQNLQEKVVDLELLLINAQDATANESEEMQAKIGTLQEKMNSLLAEKEDFVKLEIEKNSEIEKMQERIAMLERLMNSQENMAEKEMEDMQCNNEKKERNNVHTMTDLDFPEEMHAQLETLQTEIVSLKNEKCELLDAGNKKDIEIINLQEVISNSEISITSKNEAEKEVKELHTNIEALLQEIDSLRSKKLELEDANIAHVKEIQELQEKIVDNELLLINAQDAMANESEEMQARISTLQETVDSLMREKEEFVDFEIEKIREIEELQGKLQMNEKSLIHSESTSNKLMEDRLHDIEMLQEEVSTLNKEKDEKRSNYEKVKEEMQLTICNLQAEIDNLKKDIEIRVNLENEKNQKIDELLVKLTHCENSMIVAQNASEKALKEGQTNLEIVQMKIKSLEKEKKEIVNFEKEKETTIKELQDRLAASEKSLVNSQDTSEKELDEMRSNIEMLLQEVDSLKKEKSHLHNAKNAAQSQVEELTMSLSDLKKKTDELMEQNQERSEERQKAEKMIQQLIGEKESLQEDVMQLERALPPQLLKYTSLPENIEWETKWEAFTKEEKNKRMNCYRKIKNLEQMLKDEKEKTDDAMDYARKELQETLASEKQYQKLHNAFKEADDDANRLNAELLEEKANTQELRENIQKLQEKVDELEAKIREEKPEKQSNFVGADHLCKYKMESFSTGRQLEETKEQLEKSKQELEETVKNYTEKIAQLKNEMRRQYSSMDMTFDLRSGKPLNLGSMEAADESCTQNQVHGSIQTEDKAVQAGEQSSRTAVGPPDLTGHSRTLGGYGHVYQGSSTAGGFVDQYKALMLEAQNKELIRDMEKLKRQVLRSSSQQPNSQRESMRMSEQDQRVNEEARTGSKCHNPLQDLSNSSIQLDAPGTVEKKTGSNRLNLLTNTLLVSGKTHSSDLSGTTDNTGSRANLRTSTSLGRRKADDDPDECKIA